MNSMDLNSEFPSQNSPIYCGFHETCIHEVLACHQVRSFKRMTNDERLSCGVTAGMFRSIAFAIATSLKWVPLISMAQFSFQRKFDVAIATANVIAQV